MANSRYEFTGIKKDGKTDKVQVSALNLKLAEQQAKKTFVRITQTVRMRDDVAAALDGTAASA
ncbi:hypothetical protein RYA05_02045 [Pseudomonas syringae pv. actinidiae]|nr:hypothetical protein [Pseudomonas syringae pv. actinidiae]